ncbi:hypothetical protein [Streptomyces rapamycinicus]|uniref:MoeA C-terminal domain-containing protein n=1 Tax=Streptomyces rapamycinicus TaxID=1226757 RepID=A0ABR6LXI5_9ACTN|nr:hypothetical protein M271_39635 [Streptomyces rapamycinicus NRRL 5491]MBB4787057.1 hypothetical protein [Streptomyces rapamycinicus]
MHLAVEQAQKPMSLVITAGQRGDSPQFQVVLGRIRVPRLGPGRPRTRPDKVRADKTLHAVMGSSSCRERGRLKTGEGDCFVESLAVGQAVVELPEHAVEQMAEGSVVAVAGVASPVVVGVSPG